MSAERILVYVQAGRDGELAVSVLEKAGFQAEPCTTSASLCERIRAGAGAVLLAEELLHRPQPGLEDVLLHQEAWSDLPLIVFSAQRNSSTLPPETLRGFGNVIMLERPTRVNVMISAIHVALRSRRRQYQARRAIQMRDEFLAMLGHELRNPLAAVVLAGDLLDQAKDTLDARLVRSVGVIQRQTRVLGRLVDDLLDVSRVTSGKVVLQREPLQLVDILRRCLGLAEANAERAKISLALVAPANDLTVLGDPVRLDQIFGNLITNAIKYTPAGGHVQVMVTSERHAVKVQVKDDGIGIDPELLNSVFELFTQVNQSIDRSRGGMGIGLTLVRSLAQLHGGSVTAQSDGLGKGSVFRVELPLVQRAPGVHIDPIVTRAGDKRRVVVIEDNDDLREGLRALLEALGHEVHTAADGRTGVAALTAERPDIGFVDIGLPELNGYEVARRARAVLGNDVVLVALTGYGQPEDRTAAHAAGFNEHLTKPVDLSRLQKTLSATPPRT